MAEIKANAPTINTENIRAAHEQMKKILGKYETTKDAVQELDKKVLDNWVGKGRNQFESQKDILFNKIVDFGDVLIELYDALVLAEAEYQTTDDLARQKFVDAAAEKER